MKDTPMKRTRLTIVVLATVAALTAAFMAPRGQAQVGQENVKVFMRAKLAHSQEILKGLTMEDFDMIVKNAQDLSLLSQASQWQVFETPEYVRRSAEFRREADALKEAARKKNLDGATLAYFKVTINCIECHKYVRTVRAASLDRRSLLR